MQNLAVTLTQCELAWESPEDNRAQIGDLIRAQAHGTDIVILPEMFTTGFSMNAIGNAEAPGGPTEIWMHALAQELDCAVTGSIAVAENGTVFNRMLFVTPEQVVTYDKRHLFRMAGEHRRYGVGQHRVVTSWRDWRIKLEVCYDLRFPVFSRNQNDFDVAIWVANWPAARADHWRTLLKARAIENAAYSVGVNRVGQDANGLDYIGDSLVFDARGQTVADLGNARGCHTATLDAVALKDYRDAFPVHLDADDFTLNLS
jgi:omega-amidase